MNLRGVVTDSLPLALALECSVKISRPRPVVSLASPPTPERSSSRSQTRHPSLLYNLKTVSTVRGSIAVLITDPVLAKYQPATERTDCGYPCTLPSSARNPNPVDLKSFTRHLTKFPITFPLQRSSQSETRSYRLCRSLGYQKGALGRSDG